MENDFEKYNQEVDELVFENTKNIKKDLLRNTIYCFLFILVPTLYHFFFYTNILVTIFILLLFSFLTIVFLILVFELQNRHSIGVLSSMIQIIWKKILQQNNKKN